MSCPECNDDCRQGRDCPYRRVANLDYLLYDKGLFNLYNKVTTNFTLMEWIVCLVTIAILLSLAI
jgi:hypothetical protein